jgi:hypothetical protein
MTWFIGHVLVSLVSLWATKPGTVLRYREGSGGMTWFVGHVLVSLVSQLKVICTLEQRVAFSYALFLGKVCCNSVT